MSDRDLFDDSTMSFGEHLEELRQCLVKALFGVAIGTVAGLFIGGWVIGKIKEPLVETLSFHEYDQQAKALEAVSEDGLWEWLKPMLGLSYFDRQGRPDGPGPDVATPEAGGLDEPPDVDESLVVEVDRASLLAQLHGSHPDDFPEPTDADAGRPLSLTLSSPLFAEIRQGLNERVRPVTLNVEEGFFTYLKVSVITGIVLSSPWIFYQAWSFVAAGLYPHERKYVYKFGPLSFGLFAAGAAFAWFAVIPFALNFFIGFSINLGFEPNIQIGPWIGFAVKLPLIFGVAFQMPLLMLLLERIGIFEVADFREKRRIAILAIVVVSALLTPSDPITLFLMAIPLALLYELGIFLCVASPQRSQFAEVPT